MGFLFVGRVDKQKRFSIADDNRIKAFKAKRQTRRRGLALWNKAWGKHLDLGRASIPRGEPQRRKGRQGKTAESSKQAAALSLELKADGS